MSAFGGVMCSSPCGGCRLYVRNASQQATQEVGSSDDALLRAPDQDQIVIDNIVVGPLRHNLQASNDVAQPRLHIPYDDRPVPAPAPILVELLEQRVTQEMMGVQHERGLTPNSFSGSTPRAKSGSS